MNGDELLRILPFHITGSGPLASPRTWFFTLLVAAANGVYIAVIAAFVTASILLTKGLF